MKKILVTLLALTCGTAVFAQSTTEKNAYKRPSALGVSLFYTDYLTAYRFRTTSVSQTLNNKQVARLREMSPGIAVHYFKGLHNNIDFAGTIGGSFPDIIMKDGSTFRNQEKLQLEADASAQFKLFSDRYFFTPYATVGIGASYLNKKFDAILPLGLGFKFNLFDEAAIFADGTYRIPVTDRMNNYHFVYRLGFAASIGKKQEPKVIPPPPPPPMDTDGDGIYDSVDKCPTVVGVAKYDGCPVPDTDGDGINDEQDKCPTVRGIAKYQGCPIPDTDLDGINDEEDKCPTLAGTAANNGCPEVKQETVVRMNKSASRIYFATGKATLLKTSNAALAEVAKIMSEDKDLKLVIEGHTDNVGTDEYNQKLSEDRAAAVRKALLDRGVEEARIQSQGFGETKPVADNKTAAGRAKNRRVVMRPTYE